MSPSKMNLPTTLLLASLTMALGVSAAAVPVSGDSSSQIAKRTTWWKPAAGTGWQIEIDHALTSSDMTVDKPVYVIDLFDNSASTISTLHGQNRHVICYFSAGSFESWRPDASSFTSADKGAQMDGWDETWINTNSNNVRSIMAARLDLAVTKGCDGVDPDNIDAYDNGGGGFNLGTTDAINYVTWLATQAHNRGLAIGLKNGGDIVSDVIDNVDWELNEQCQQYSECDSFTDFITANKPVFHIEYPSSAPNVPQSVINSICGYSPAAGFSTIMKQQDLSDWIIAC